MSDTHGGPLSPEECRRFMEYTQERKRFGTVEFKTEAGKVTRVMVQHTLLPHEVRALMTR